jgi:hypothetical protein
VSDARTDGCSSMPFALPAVRRAGQPAERSLSRFDFRCAQNATPRVAPTRPAGGAPAAHASGSGCQPGGGHDAPSAAIAHPPVACVIASVPIVSRSKAQNCPRQRLKGGILAIKDIATPGGALGQSVSANRTYRKTAWLKGPVEAGRRGRRQSGLPLRSRRCGAGADVC